MFVSLLELKNLESLREMKTLEFIIRHGSKDDGSDWDGTDDQIFVNGVKLWDFIEQQKESKNEFLKDQVVLITRLFDNRVKAFINNILMANEHVEHYSYTIGKSDICFNRL